MTTPPRPVTAPPTPVTAPHSLFDAYSCLPAMFGQGGAINRIEVSANCGHFEQQFGHPSLGPLPPLATVEHRSPTGAQEEPYRS